MIEAVGWQYFDEFFSRCSDLLRPGRVDAAPGDRGGRRRVRGREGQPQLHQGARVSLGVPALNRRDRRLRAARDRHARGRAGRHHRALPRDAQPLARALRRGGGPTPRRSATTAPSGGSGSCTSPTARAASASAGSASCSWSWRSRGIAARRASRGRTLEALAARVGSRRSGGAAVSRGGHLPGGQPDGALRDGRYRSCWATCARRPAQAARKDARRPRAALLPPAARPPRARGARPRGHRAPRARRRAPVRGDPAGRGAGGASRARMPPSRPTSTRSDAPA